MGVYDFFKGECPYCHKDVDNHPEFGKCGDIQSKIFIFVPTGTYDDCFREFFPNKKMPFTLSDSEYTIGPTCCCNKMIKAIFKNNILTYNKIS
jgi:hypothetical protein